MFKFSTHKEFSNISYWYFMYLCCFFASLLSMIAAYLLISKLSKSLGSFYMFRFFNLSVFTSFSWCNLSRLNTVASYNVFISTQEILAFAQQAGIVGNEQEAYLHSQENAPNFHMNLPWICPLENWTRKGIFVKEII